MALSKKEFSNFIKTFDFRNMFVEMGWNNDRYTQIFDIDSKKYTLESIAQKSNFKILLCQAEDGKIPDYQTRKNIDNKITAIFYEHLIIFQDSQKSEQIWQFVKKQTGKPNKITETRYHVKQSSSQLLYQRAAGLIFEIDEEENITIVDVNKKVEENFQQNNEKITKQFYDKFKKEHGVFLKFISGIEDDLHKNWYASLMLNRLMFCYFIQKKGFLDNNKNYLRQKLTYCEQFKGKNNFYSFYRSFLLVLFHEGLGSNDKEKHLELIGKIPYLNGGLFDIHEIESNYTNIQIHDEAFDNIFTFFDQYEWHLDTRISASGKDINPDVIGYIFEKYINDRANMGAYYTKEDITDYISKNCILPFLFEQTKRKMGKNFDVLMLTQIKSGAEKYIYESLKKGNHLDLPAQIEEGIAKIDQRTAWNKAADESFALPTEIWREVVERRKRVTEIKHKIQNNEITNINDFITYNLNISVFAQDILENVDDPKFIEHFYEALTKITILDPTCGSGAFLFAAMNILEPLYETCLMRMRIYTQDEDRKNAIEKTFSNQYKNFRAILEQTQNTLHPNLQYFIYKSIILQNLHGVDIMQEATEIAKLRLFLKLVATVEADTKKTNLGLEPLPDIDFNIRAGNTLVGFANHEELKKGLEKEFDFENQEKKITEQMETVSKAFEYYKKIQLLGEDFTGFKQAKANLKERLTKLDHDLNEHSRYVTYC